MSQPNTEKSVESVSTGVSSAENMEKVTPSTKTSQVQYKIVKVRKPDGTIVKVRRPISEEEFAKLKSTQSKPEPAPATQAPIPAKNSESTAVVTSSPTKTTSTEVIATVNEKSNTVVTEVKSTTPVTQSEKTIETSAKETQKSTETSVPSKTERTLDTAAKGARFYRGLHKLHKGSSRLISVLAPGWEVGDLQDGDEEVDDDDSDDDDDEQYDSDEEQNGQNNSTNHGTANMNTNAAAKGIATTTVSNLAASNTAKAQSEDPEKGVKATVTKPQKIATFSEKEVPAIDSEKGSLEKPYNDATEGRDLARRYKDWSRYVVWAIMISFPVLFIVVGILVAHRNGHNIDDPLSVGTEQALKVAVSIWPIIFAGIVAQSLRAYATYRVERGVRLMTLEQLVNSNSVASSIKQPFLLRRFNLITIALIMLWSLSPLATQAMQRISTTDYTQNSTSVAVRFVNTASGTNILSASTTDFNTVEADFNRLYAASFLSQTYGLGQDAYGNPLIPILDKTWASEADNQSWFETSPEDVKSLTSYSEYASAYGIPISYTYALEGVDDISATKAYYSDDQTGQSNLDLYIPAAYLDFECDPLKVKTYDEIYNGNTTWGSPNTENENTLLLAMTPMSGRTPGTLTLASLITLNTTTEPNTNVNTSSSDNMTYATTSCTFTQVFLNASIICSDSGCYTNEIMRIDIDGSYDTSGAENFVTGILGTSGSTNFADDVVIATDTEKFLATQNGSIIGVNPRINLTTIDLPLFTQNLAFLVNTFWSIGFSPSAIAVPLGNSSNDQQASYADAQYMVYNQIYLTNKGWLAALFICSGLLVLASIFSILWDSRSVSPDVLGFASTVVRKSKYVKLPKVDSAAGGAERARALGDVRVMMQDVKPDAAVGRIALGTAHPGAKRLEPGRNYR